MRLYRSHGYIWTGTQADAREAQGGKDFEQIEVPTDKPGLLDWLNANAPGKDHARIMAGALPAPSPAEPEAVQPVAPPSAPKPSSGAADIETIKAMRLGEPAWDAENLKARRDALDLTTRALAIQTDRLALEEAIANMPPHALDALAGLIDMQRKALMPKADDQPEALPAPRPRARTRTPQAQEA